MRLIPSGVVCVSLGLLLTAGCNRKASNGTATVGDGGPGGGSGGGSDAAVDVGSGGGGGGGGSDAAVDVGPRDVAFERAQYVDGGPVGGRAFDDCTGCDPVGSFNPTVEFCGEGDACSTMKSCFRVTPDIGMCDYAYRDATTCGNGMSSHADDCGCNGLTCAAGQTCLAVNDNGGGTGRYNTCVDKPCASASECSGGLACTPGTYIRAPGHPQPRPAVGRCFRPACMTDAECTDGDAGRCAIALHNGTGGLEFAVRCVYRNVGSPPAGPDPSWCAGTTVRLVRRLPPGTGSDYHICPDLAR